MNTNHSLFNKRGAKQVVKTTRNLVTLFRARGEYKYIGS